MFADPSVFYLGWLDRTQAMLRFAEAKNGTLLAAILAVFLACAQNDTTAQLTSPWSYVYGFALVVLCFTFVDVAISFWPRGRSNLSSRADVDDTLNPLYFADVASLSVAQLVDIISEKVPDDWDVGDLETLHLEQIIQNSRICVAKLRHFQRGSLFFVVAVTLLFACFASINL